MKSLRNGAADPGPDPLGGRGARPRRRDRRRLGAKARARPEACRPAFRGVRGPLKLAEAMAVLPAVRRRVPEARLPFEDWRVLRRSAGPRRLRRAPPASTGRPALRETAVQALGLLPALVALSDRDLAAYHGVEHKAIAAYEQGVDDPARCRRSTSAAARTSSRR